MRAAQGPSGRSHAPAPGPADPDSVAAAEDVALRILAAAAQSEAGLRRRLQGRGFSEEAAASATAAMVNHGYVDDGSLAQSIAARSQRTGHGRIRVAAELRARGVDDGAISQTLSDVDPEAERTAALALGRRLAHSPARAITDRQGRLRLGGAMQRRGFDHETVAWVLRELEREG